MNTVSTSPNDSAAYGDGRDTGRDTSGAGRKLPAPILRARLKPVEIIPPRSTEWTEWRLCADDWNTRVERLASC